MNCIKCGKDTKSEQIFCQQCLEVMEKYPVKPDVHVQLPNRPAVPAQKRSGKKRLLASADEQLAVLQKRSRRQSVWIGILSVLLIAAAAGILYLLYAEEILRFLEI